MTSSKSLHPHSRGSNPTMMERNSSLQKKMTTFLNSNQRPSSRATNMNNTSIPKKWITSTSTMSSILMTQKPPSLTPQKMLTNQNSTRNLPSKRVIRSPTGNPPSTKARIRTKENGNWHSERRREFQRMLHSVTSYRQNPMPKQL